MSTLVRIQQDQANVAHYNTDGRAALFDKANKNRIRAGAIVQITSLTSMTKGKPVTFAGVVISVRHKGIDTSVTLRNYVLKTGVEQTYKVYSPMITAIKVLKPNASFNRNKLYFLRENPQLVKWGVVDELVKTEAKKLLDASEAKAAKEAAASAKKGGKKGTGKK
ncbi:translation protein SH3-like domain-containing protein [Catenaria anguillulae PL171]|uniref:Translation protein SH3-like domain-containing protein n=1 Tax=Catenaria anguillulae PL171 TaxID=765915 RepID=A0A1Y2H5M8_9FUNG|nr:translation protein SH3-like domain-containing protein [Catenaria anguillulae PL171]